MKDNKRIGGMYLVELNILNFKNISQAAIEPCPGINGFVGGNGAGKTNVLDAVHYLSMSKSALPMTDGQSIRHGTDFFMLDGRYESERTGRERVVCTFRRQGGKVLKRNGKEYEKLADHIGFVPVVIVSPADGFLVSEAAEERRRYLNAFLSQTDRSYLGAVMRYNHVLGERNRLLKLSGGVPGGELLDVYDSQLEAHGTAVHRQREALVAQLRPQVEEFYRQLSDDREQVELEYRSELNTQPLGELLRAGRVRDAACGYTTSGIHRDDLVMRIGGYPLRKYGSQGQQKSFLIALKLAQYRILAQRTGVKPLLLLDDLFDKLDTGRVARLLALVGGGDFGQIFISDCNRQRLEALLDAAGSGYALFGVEDGAMSRIK